MHDWVPFFYFPTYAKLDSGGGGKHKSRERKLVLALKTAIKSCDPRELKSQERLRAVSLKGPRANHEAILATLSTLAS